MQSVIYLTLLGFGEAATAFVKGWKNSAPGKPAIEIKAFDIKTCHDKTRASKLADYDSHKISGQRHLQSAIAGTNIIFSMVTADQAAKAALAAAEYIEAGQYYFDCNSCSPVTKKENARIITNTGGLYIDVAIMAPVYPKLHRTPMLISGEDAETALRFFTALNMKASLVEGGVGQSSAIKMVRSIMIKGMEALNAECLLTARKMGVDQTVLQSLEKTFPGFNWPARSGYMLERMMAHGLRRAAEMREAALTVEQMGLNNGMAKATVEWQQLIGELALSPEGDKFEALADRIIKKL